MDTQLIVKAITAISFGIVGGILLTPIFVILRKTIYGPFINKKIVDKAIKDGHVVKAYLKKTYDYYRDDGTVDGRKYAEYYYECNGHKYKFTAISSNKIHDEITLYYIKNPRKASASHELFLTQRSPWIKLFLLIYQI